MLCVVHLGVLPVMDWPASGERFIASGMASAGAISARLIFSGNNLTSTLAFTGDYRVLRVSKRPTEILGADHPTPRFSTRSSTIEASLRRPHCPAAAATTTSAQTSLNQTTHPPLRVRRSTVYTTAPFAFTLPEPLDLNGRHSIRRI